MKDSQEWVEIIEEKQGYKINNLKTYIEEIQFEALRFAGADLRKQTAERIRNLNLKDKLFSFAEIDILFPSIRLLDAIAPSNTFEEESLIIQYTGEEPFKPKFLNDPRKLWKITTLDNDIYGLFSK